MQVKHFIEECLLQESERPSAGELLEHPLMQVGAGVPAAGGDEDESVSTPRDSDGDKARGR
jgi:hypothetical protein